MANKSIRNIAVACFSFYVVCCFQVSESINIGVLIEAVLTILVVIALLKNEPKLSAISYMIRSLLAIIVLISGILLLILQLTVFSWNPIAFQFRTVIILLFSPMLTTVVNVLLLLASIKTNKARTYGLIAACVATGRAVVGVTLNMTMGITTSIATIVYEIVFVTCAILLGLAYSNYMPNEKTAKAANTSIIHVAEQETIQAVSVEKLLRLKALLDDGVISQEEFDEQKKKMLNL